MRARNKELFGLIPASLLLTAGFAAVFIQRSNQLSTVSLTYGAVFLGLCLAAHVFIRVTLPYADPYHLPAGRRARLLRPGDGVPDRRRRPSRASRRSGSWSGWCCSPRPIIVFRDYRKLENYRYLIVVASLGLLILPRFFAAGERRLPVGQRPVDLVPADRVRQGRSGDLPRQLPARHATGARLGAEDPRFRASPAEASGSGACCCGGWRW